MLALPTIIPLLLAISTPTLSALLPVVVGGPQDTFVPNVLSAAVGDVIQFQFSNGNHTVTQSSADAACSPLTGGVNSGHIPFVDGQTDVGVFNLPITSAETMFLYCATGPHCQEGQVMVLNPYVVPLIHVPFLLPTQAFILASQVSVLTLSQRINPANSGLLQALASHDRQHRRHNGNRWRCRSPCSRCCCFCSCSCVRLYAPISSVS